jgi:hypothetical protein
VNLVARMSGATSEIPSAWKDHPGYRSDVLRQVV